MVVTLQKADIKEGKLLIGGAWMGSASCKTFPTRNPATGEVIAHLAEAGKEDVDRAVKAAREAFEVGDWRRMAPAERGRILWHVGDLILKYAEELAELETLDTGKPISDSRKIDIPLAADVFHYYAGWTTKIEGETLPVPGQYLNYTLREPIGVVGVIVPWNFPLLLASRKVAPALAAGNVAVVKPAALTPLTAMRLGEICLEAGIPAGAVSVLTGFGATAGVALADHPGVDKIAFTGGTATGKELMARASGTLKKLTLELGGKSPNIVFSDADLEKAARGVTSGIFYNNGEVCTAGSRLFVEDGCYGSFLDKVLERVHKLVPGDPLNPKTRFGPLISEEHLERVLGYVRSARSEGARLLTGGERVEVGNGKGYFMQPTVFDRVHSGMRIAREEIFGPVLAITRFHNFQEAMALSNETQYGLAAAVWTCDLKKAHQAARELQAGTVWINTYNVYDSASPYGGYKMSGQGRENGYEGLEAYLQTKSVWVDLS